MRRADHSVLHEMDYWIAVVHLHILINNAVIEAFEHFARPRCSGMVPAPGAGGVIFVQTEFVKRVGLECSVGRSGKTHGLRKWPQDTETIELLQGRVMLRVIGDENKTLGTGAQFGMKIVHVLGNSRKRNMAETSK